MIVLAEMVNGVCFATIILLHSCWCYDNSMRTCLFHQSKMDYFLTQKNVQTNGSDTTIRNLS